MTSAGLVGLAIVLVVAGGNIPDWASEAAREPLPASFSAGSGIVIGGFLAFYAFIGFEDLAHLGEEARQAKRAVPQAIFVTLAVSLLLYLAVAMAALGTLSAERLEASRAPLIEILRASQWAVGIVAALSLVTIADGLIAQLVMVTRTAHDLGKRRGGAPRLLSGLSGRTRTPVVATLAAGSLILALAMAFDTRSLAAGTSAIILLIFAASNAALIALKRARPSDSEGFRVPAWLPWVAFASCIGLLAGLPFANGGG